METKWERGGWSVWIGESHRADAGTNARPGQTEIGLLGAPGPTVDVIASESRNDG
ncbi:MAG: hypothetical protein IH987_13105 [Planctomycetes bacterium]|nr:hypothetical protein [Planctomycetota bacterium]